MDKNKPVFKLRKEIDGLYTLWYKRKAKWWYRWKIDTKQVEYDFLSYTHVMRTFFSREDAHKRAIELNTKLIKDRKKPIWDIKMFQINFKNNSIEEYYCYNKHDR